ncbi:putative uncharacterized protein [Clostridium sp. CAG:1024]|jgi:cell filamentation protein|nr:putative uncharacterized protein [Clostridium sp. CAG:1024]
MPDPYLYPNTNVLINKFDIQDAKRLSEVENDLVYIKLFEVDDFMQDLSFDTAGLKALHHYLFEDIYDWAGNFRTINIFKIERVIPGKSVEYGDHTQLQRLLDAAFFDLDETRWDELSKEARAKVFSRMFARIWQIHPFREGNTRTVTTFMLGYANRHGIAIDGSLLSKYNAYVRESLVMASIGEYSEYEHLEKIILDAMGDADGSETDATEEATEQYAKINEYEVKDYYYRQFETDK